MVERDCTGRGREEKRGRASKAEKLGNGRFTGIITKSIFAQHPTARIYRHKVVTLP
jgi:hypothetical protein